MRRAIKNTILLIFFLFTQITISQPYFKGGFALSHHYFYGYDWSYGSLNNYWVVYKEFVGLFATKIDYGFNTVKYLKFKNPWATTGTISAGFRWNSGEIDFGYTNFGYYYAEALYHPNNESVKKYYVRLWDSNLFSVINTENRPSFISPIDLLAQRDFNYMSISISLSIKKLWVNLLYGNIENWERILYKQYARYFDIFRNNITIEDISANRQELFLAAIGLTHKNEITKSSYLLGFEYKLGLGVVINSLSFKNNWIDIDDAVLYGPKETGDSIAVYYYGLAVEQGKIVEPNVNFSYGFTIYFYPVKNIKFYSGVGGYVIPNYLIRTYYQYPWGGTLPVDVPPGLKWERIRRTVAYINLTLIGVSAEF